MADIDPNLLEKALIAGETMLRTGWGQFLAGLLASSFVGIWSARFQFRKSMRLESELRIQELVQDYIAFRFGIPVALRQDFTAIAGGWDNLFYEAFDPLRRSLFDLGILTDQFNVRYLDHLPKPKVLLFKGLTHIGGELRGALIAFAEDLPKMDIPAREARAEAFIDDTMAKLQEFEFQVLSGVDDNAWLNEHAFEVIRSATRKRTKNSFANAPVHALQQSASALSLLKKT